MKITIAFGVIVLVIGLDSVFGLPTGRQKRWDLFSRAREFYDNVRGHFSESADTATDLADAIAVQAREHLHQALDHLKDIEVNSRVLLDEAGRRLQNIGRDILENSRDELADAANFVADSINDLADRLRKDDDKERQKGQTTTEPRVEVH